MLDKLMKHAKHFTSKKEKGVSDLIHFYENGDLFMTDAHVAVYAHNVNPDTKSYTTRTDWSTTDIEPYSSYMKFYPNNSPFITEINVSEMLIWAQALEAVNNISNLSEKDLIAQLRLTVEDGKLIGYYRGKNVKSKHEITVCENEFERYFTLNLITKSMRLLKDLKYETCLLYAKDSTVTPVLLVSPDWRIEILILPCVSDWK